MRPFGTFHNISVCNPCCYFSRLGTSVSRWCTDGCNTCDMNRDMCIMPLFAYLTQLDAVSVTAGSAIPFTGESIISDGFELVNGELLLSSPGVYMVSYRVQIPMAANANTSFVIRVDGVDIAGTQQTVAHTAGQPPVTLCAQAIFEVCEVMEGTSVGLFTTNSLDLPMAMGGDVVATMTVMSL